MNKWLEKSLDLAQNEDYLDRLLEVYPIRTHPQRQVDPQIWKGFKHLYEKGDANRLLFEKMLEFKKFPIKNSYVSFLRRDRNAIFDNPKVVEKICNMVLAMDLDDIYFYVSEPMENNRTMGSHFRNYVEKLLLDFSPTGTGYILLDSDAVLKKHAEEQISYERNKGLDFFAKLNETYIIGAAKFLTEMGGHQNNQLLDALTTLETPVATDQMVEKVLFLDGVIYQNAMFKKLENYQDYNIMSALLLEEFVNEFV